MPELVHSTGIIKKEQTKVTIETGQGLNSMQAQCAGVPNQQPNGYLLCWELQNCA